MKEWKRRNTIVKIGQEIYNYIKTNDSKGYLEKNSMLNGKK